MDDVTGSDLRGRQLFGDAQDVDVRCRVIDRVIDAGGEVLALSVDNGVVHVRIRIGTRAETSLIEHMLGEIPGVARLELVVDFFDVSEIQYERRASGDSADRSGIRPWRGVPEA